MKFIILLLVSISSQAATFELYPSGQFQIEDHFVRLTLNGEEVLYAENPQRILTHLEGFPPTPAICLKQPLTRACDRAMAQQVLITCTGYEFPELGISVTCSSLFVGDHRYKIKEGSY
jgi:hypothetical protein